MDCNANFRPLDNVFGELLDGLFNRVNNTVEQAIEKATDAGIDLEIQAGKEIGIAIQNAENAYKSSLDYTIDKVSAEAQKTFNQLTSMVEKFEGQIADDMATLMVDAQQLMNTLPFSSKQPQLSSTQPRYIVINDIATTSLVTFKGNFPYSAKKDFEPAFALGEESCMLVDSTTQSFTFQVPQRAFIDPQQNRYSYKVGQLTVPFDDGWVWSHKAEFNYKVGLGALPQLAGQGTATYISNIENRVTVPKTSQQYFFDGNSWHPEPWHIIYQEVYPDPDWTIDVTQSPVFHSEDVHGTHEQGIESVTPEKIVMKIILYCEHGHDIGKVRVWVDFHQYQIQKEQKEREENFDMNWKDSKLLEPQTNETISKVIFNDYNGTTQVYAGPEIDSKNILQVEAEGNGIWKLWTEPPQDLTLASDDVPPKLKENLQLLKQLEHLRFLTNVPKELRIYPSHSPKQREKEIASETSVVDNQQNEELQSKPDCYSPELETNLKEIYDEIEKAKENPESLLHSQAPSLLESANLIKDQLSKSQISQEAAEKSIQDLQANMKL